MVKATKSPYVNKSANISQSLSNRQAQVGQKISLVAKKLMDERNMNEDEALQAAHDLLKQQMSDEELEEYNLGGTIGSAVGAVGGSVIPGVGTALGSTVGGAAGTLIGEAVSSDKNPKQFTGRKREEYDTLMNKSKGKDSVFYKHGGNINKAPGMKSQYEAEGGEVVEGEAPKVTGEEGNMKEQTDDTYVVKGPSHENGGVEGKGGERVFSDSIKIPGTSQTYADAAKKIGSRTGQKSMEKKMEAKPYDQILKRSLNRTKQRNEAQKDKLFELQEQQKDVENIGDSSPEMKSGGWIQKAVKGMKQDGTVGSLTRAAKNAGYDSAMKYARHILNNKGDFSSKMIQKANFAVNANKKYGGEITATSDYDVVEDGMSMEKFRETYPEQEMEYGGKLPKYFNGGKFGDPDNIPERQALKQSTVLRNPEGINKVDTTEQEQASFQPDTIDNTVTDTSNFDSIPEGTMYPSYGPNEVGGSDMTPAQKNLYERMMQQQEKTDQLTPISRAVQAAPAMYNLMDSGDRNYLEPQKNRRAQASIRQLEDMPTEYNIQDQLRSISDAYDKTTDQMNRYSASPNVARANMRNAFAKRLAAESKAYNTKENKETQLEAQKDRALAQQQYQVGTQAAKYRDKANMMNLKTQAAAENQKRTGLSQLSNLAANINREEQNKLTELQTRNLQYETLGNSGVGSRTTTDAEYIKFVMNERPEYAKKHLPKLYEQWKKKNKGK